MKNQQIDLIFNGEFAYISNEKKFSLEEIGILNKSFKKFNSPAYWVLKIDEYIENDKKLICDVLSYEVGKKEFSNNQAQLSNRLNEVSTLMLKSINTTGLLNTYYGEKNFNNSKKIDSYNSVIAEPKKPQVFIIEDEFQVHLKDISFKLGAISFKRKIEGLNRQIDLEISNYEIREEFDAIKNYFANALNTKKISVYLKLKIEDGVYEVQEIKSPEIAKIDKQIIDNVKFYLIKDTIKKKVKVEIDKNIFTMDEYFDTFTEEKVKSNTFFKNEKEMFEDILKIQNTKHYKNLRFLSSKHAHTIMKLRFIHKPFSFLFLLEGEKHYHLVWETLNTEEATYIWHIDKNTQVLKNTVKKIEEIINTIKVQGKTAYISNNDDKIRRVYHDYSLLVDGFVKWKQEIENYLT